MLTKFEVKNYKNFKDKIVVDLRNTSGYKFNSECVQKGVISKAIIYGRNATGKTNLGKAMIDIVTLFWDVAALNIADNYLNADTQESEVFYSYTFQFANDEIVFEYTRNSDRVLQTEVFYVNGKKVYDIDFSKGEAYFGDLGLIGAESANIEIYKKSIKNQESNIESNPYSFAKWIIGNVIISNNSLIRAMVEFVKKMKMGTVKNTETSMAKKDYELLITGLQNEQELKRLEKFLNDMGVECRLVLKKLPDGKYELYFQHERLVPFYENASSGSLSLTKLYFILRNALITTSFLYLDEFDAYYHYEMAESLVNFFKSNYPKIQIIMTTHNTNLMSNELMRPDCLFILSGSGTLTALCDATERELREGHNLEKMYISGEFREYE